MTRSRFLLFLTLGIVLGQGLLFGPSLVGRKILLPVDVLASPSTYLPEEEARKITIQDPILSDPVLAFEPARRFAARELRAGRLPLWNPDNYCGAPTALSWPWSLPHLLYYLFPTPFVLVWMQLLKSLIAGVGACLFCRRVLALGREASLVAGWAYPLSGFLMLWSSFIMTHAVIWLPWILVAVDAAVRRPFGRAVPGLALASGAALFGGQSGPQVLLASAIFAVWALVDARQSGASAGRTRRASLSLVVGWSLGILLALPQWLPMIEYLPTSHRLVERAAGEEERPPFGPGALPQIVLPDFYGSHSEGRERLVPGNRLESSAAAYAGLLVTLWLVPLAWGSRKHRSVNLVLGIMTTLSLAWVLNLPGLVALLRLPGLRMLPHNRFVFVAGFALLAMGAIGFDRLVRGETARRSWFVIPAGLAGILGIWSAVRAFRLPDSFLTTSLAAAAVCVVCVALWSLTGTSMARRREFQALGALCLLGELLAFSFGLNPQCDPSLYYPRIEFLEKVAERPGRSLCMACLPPNLNQSAGLRDLRGYDGADPAALVELLELVRDRRVPSVPYAVTQWYAPRMIPVPPDSVRVPGVLDMLGLRSILLQGEPLPGLTPEHAGDGYWFLDNPNALPRAFVPRAVKRASTREERLRILGSDRFDPRALALSETDLGLPARIRGTAVIERETPRRITLRARMETAGLVVLADLWYEGWEATLDGHETEIARVNHALRGFVVPEGEHEIELRYEPLGFRVGVWLMSLALAVVSSLAIRTPEWLRRSG